MDPIIVPRAKSVRDPNRPASGLLLAQVKHLQKAERNLPPQYHSGIFIQAIQTEGDAAEYVRAVTEAIHRAHDEAPTERVRRRAKKRKGVIEIAAVADEAGARKAKSRNRPKKDGGAGGPKT